MKLLSPCAFGTLALNNPVVALPFYTAYADEKGAPTPLLLAHYKDLAQSGVGLVVVEASSIAEEFSGRHSLCAFGQAGERGLAQIRESIGPDTRAVVQIVHTGRYSFTKGCFAPSAIPAFGNPDFMPKVMDENDMDKVITAFSHAAATVKKAGYDGVELHGGTGYLLSSFISPRTNHRTDAYGGSIENRSRFPLRVASAVRGTVGDFPIGYRFLAEEWSDDGLTLEDSAAFARLLEKELSPAYLSVATGTYECFALFPNKKQPQGYMLEAAATIKKAVPTTAVIAAGHLESPVFAESILAEGKADGIGLGRVLFADMSWMLKASGKMAAPVTECVQCDNCMRQVQKGQPAFCTMWPKEKRHSVIKGQKQ